MCLLLVSFRSVEKIQNCHFLSFFVLLSSTVEVKKKFPFRFRSTVLRLKKDCAKTLHERYGCVFTDRFIHVYMMKRFPLPST